MNTVIRWFEKWEIPYDELYFAKGDKTKIIKKTSADIHIEDNFIEAEEIRKSRKLSFPAFFF